MGLKVDELIRQRFGRLTVIEDGLIKDGKKGYVLCRCDCGNEKIFRKYDLLKVERGTKSCGCIRREIEEKDRQAFIGKRFGRLVVLSLEYIKNQATFWRCACDCGNECIVARDNLRSGGTQSCGCLKEEARELRCTTHGMTHTRLHSIWSGIKKRCNNKNCKAFKNYGGRGIKICDEWSNDFLVFYAWSCISGYADNLSIDRIDNDGDYCPENCKWVTTEEQNRNTRQCIYVTIEGVIKTISEWARIAGVCIKTFKRRLALGLTGKDLIAPPRRSNNIRSDKARIKGIWRLIIHRCNDEDNPDYKDYGGRGIYMCTEWLEDFNNFYTWSIAAGYGNDLTLDRIDNEYGYAPNNCRWTTKQIQARNRRNSIMVEHNGVIKTTAELARELGISGTTFRSRLRAGMPEDRLFYAGSLSKLNRGGSRSRGK
jgi:hypothetical protein